MKDVEHQIRSYFLKAKEHDLANRSVPSFDEFVSAGGRSKRIHFGLVPKAIAAAISLIVLFYTLFNNADDTTNTIQETTTVLMGEKEENSQMIIEDSQEITLNTWESPTSNLINDF